MSYQSFEGLDVWKKPCSLSKEFIHFLHRAKGSAAELRTQLYIAEKTRLIPSEKRKEPCSQLISISKMLYVLTVSLTDLKLKT